MRNTADIEAERDILKEKEFLLLRATNMKAHLSDWVARATAYHDKVSDADKAEIIAFKDALRTDLANLIP